MLSGTGVHVECRSTLNANTSNGYRYYRCTLGDKGLATRCEHRSHKAEPVEDQISQMFLAWEAPDDWAERVGEVLSTPQDNEARRRSLEARIARAEEAWLEGYVESTKARTQIDTARAELTTLDTDIPMITGEDFRTAAGLWPHMTAEERRGAPRHSPSVLRRDRSRPGCRRGDPVHGPPRGRASLRSGRRVRRADRTLCLVGRVGCRHTATKVQITARGLIWRSCEPSWRLSRLQPRTERAGRTTLPVLPPTFLVGLRFSPPSGQELHPQELWQTASRSHRTHLRANSPIPTNVGGSAWESNPPRTATQPHNGFDVRRGPFRRVSPSVIP